MTDFPYKIISLLRIKNEENWLQEVFESIEKFSSEIIVLDGGSTDKSLNICKNFEKVRIFHQQESILDEVRDKNFLLDEAKKSNPDFIFMLDGDEILSPNAEKTILSEINDNPDVDIFEFQSLFIWDNPHQYRVDGIFENTWQKRLLKIKSQSPDLHFQNSPYPFNLHLGHCPQNAIGWNNSLKSRLKILHYGYYTDELRQEKYLKYNKLDPNNVSFDGYRHIISGSSTLSGSSGMKFRILPETMIKHEIERIDPSKPEQKFLYQEHLVRYLFASHLTKDKIVLDAACGNGYGAALLIEKGARKVTGLDISIQTINSCKKKYFLENLEFDISDCSSTPYQNSTFDTVVSFETLEHLEIPEQTMSEFKRILKLDGTLIISTPNVENYVEDNPYHKHEFNLLEFESLLKKFFKNVNILFQFYPSSMMIGNYNKTISFETNFVDDKINDEMEPLYFIAICSDSELPIITNNNFIFKDSNLITGKNSHLKELREKNTANESHLKELREKNTANESHLKELHLELNHRLKSYEDELQKVRVEYEDELQKVRVEYEDELQKVRVEYEDELQTIHNSKIWRIFRKIDNLRQKS
jgi:2-polyprenyl-3-methyl-5-hydroxy-6-metoxy-1,4-benzoquinol methylase